MLHSMSIWLENLNPEQQLAVSHGKGPLLILAGAGSGKTTVLVARTGRLIDEEKILPERICVLTFTNKAAHELKMRVARKVGQRARKVWAGTFHGFGLQLLKRHWKEAELPKKFGVVDGSDSLAILKDLARDHRVIEKERFSMERLMERVLRIRQNRHQGAASESYLDDSPESALALVLAPKYETRLRHLGVVDFEELLLAPLKLLKKNPLILDQFRSEFDYVMVDEFQDTNHMQMRLIDELTASHRNIAVVGDDDQSIYGWRGAEVRNILDFPTRYENCEVVRLERNYRSSAKIISLANAVIGNNKARHSKVLRPGLSDQGQLPELFTYENDEMEIDQVVEELQRLNREGRNWKSMAILYRSNSQGGLMEGGLRRAQIPYKLTGGTALFDRKEAKDSLAFIRSSLHPTEVSFRRIINLPPRGIGEKTLDSIDQINPDLEFFRRARLWAKNNSEEKASESITNLFAFLEDLKSQLVMSPEDAETVLTRMLREIGYRSHLDQCYRDPQVAEKRWSSVMILGRILDGMFKRHGRNLFTLEMFIDSMELHDPITESKEEQEDQVQMMTLHACKGLEFPVVILLGLEEDLLPHAKLGQSVDEERRLFYVGVTRAKEHLILTKVRQRKRYGRMQDISPSRFLLEIVPSLYQEHDEIRPLLAEEREAMVSNFLKQLENKIAQRDKTDRNKRDNEETFSQ